MSFHKHRSFWLQDIASSLTPTPPLRGSQRFDVAIVGGGYVGLWTAYFLKQKSPGTSVAVIEQDICGGGASGRNGGFILSYWPKFSSLIPLCGKEEAVRVCRDSVDAIQEIDTITRGSGLDVHFRRSPWLWTATSSAQMGAWEGVTALCEKHGHPVFERLPDAEIARRSGSPAHRAGVVENSAATVHPARLVRAIRTLCLKAGVEIFENTPMKAFTRRAPYKITTGEGELVADKVILATNAWAAGIRELRRAIVPITSDMIVTAPIPEALRRIGWTGGECITDSQTMVDYYQVTRDGRVAFGKGGWGIAYGGDIGPDFDRNTQRAQTVIADFHRYYPELKDAPITHDWCGPIDRTPNSLPLLGVLPGTEGIFYGVGWSGNGVGPSVLGGKILSSLALGLQDRWAKYPLVGKSVGTFPPEPIRYLGAHVVRAAVAAKERKEIEDRTPAWLAVQLSKLAPAGLEDKQ